MNDDELLGARVIVARVKCQCKLSRGNWYLKTRVSCSHTMGTHVSLVSIRLY